MNISASAQALIVAIYSGNCGYFDQTLTQTNKVTTPQESVYNFERGPKQFRPIGAY